MHHSRLCSIVIDCKTGSCRGRALLVGSAWPPDSRRRRYSAGKYVPLVTADDEPAIEVQKVDHDSRVHLDIESDDIDAEVRRLEALGAKKIEAIRTWVVMEAPTGQRFCVIRPQRGGKVGLHANEWQ